jgi:hypothetical protein
VAAAVGWRTSSNWLDETGVSCVLAQPSTAQRAVPPLRQRQDIHMLKSDTCTPLFPHPHLTPKCTHLRPTTPTIPFYGTVFCVILYISSPIYMYSVLYTMFLYFPSVVVSVGDPTMCSAFFV